MVKTFLTRGLIGREYGILNFRAAPFSDEFSRSQDKRAGISNFFYVVLDFIFKHILIQSK